MRNIIVHNYDGIDYNLVWDTISIDIPELEKTYIVLLMNEFKYNLADIKELGLNTENLKYYHELFSESIEDENDFCM